MSTQLRISFDAKFDRLIALEYGRVVDRLAYADYADLDEDCIGFRRWHSRRHRVCGFGVRDFSRFDAMAPDPEDPRRRERPIWRSRGRFDVPTLGLSGAKIGEIVVAAQSFLGDCQYSTPDVVMFDLAVELSADGDLEQAEQLFRQSLALGEMKAHYGLGYTLLDLERPREAYGHLRHYTEINGRNPWAWRYFGRACEAIGELDQAEYAYDRAAGHQQMFDDCDEDYVTDAPALLEALQKRRKGRSSPSCFPSLEVTGDFTFDDNCPRCGSADLALIIYGLPDRRLAREAARGEIVLGGCVIEAANIACRSCDARWLAKESWDDCFLPDYGLEQLSVPIDKS